MIAWYADEVHDWITTGRDGSSDTRIPRGVSNWRSGANMWTSEGRAMSGLSIAIKQTVPSVAKSLAALRAMNASCRRQRPTTRSSG